MFFINEADFDVLVLAGLQQFIVPKKSKYYFNEKASCFYMEAVPCIESKVKIKIPFAGINTFGSEHIVCDIVCSCAFLAKDILPSSSVFFNEVKTDTFDRIRYLSLFVKSEGLVISELSFKAISSSKVQRKYKFLLLFIVYGFLIWMCGAIWGLLNQEYVVATISIFSGVLSLIFYKIKVSKFNERIIQSSYANEEITNKIAGFVEEEETLEMFNELEQKEAHSMLKKIAIRVAKNIYKKLM